MQGVSRRSMKDMSVTVKDAAEMYVEAGLHVIPIKCDGTKEPALETWKEYQTRQPREDELDQWFDHWEERGLAILGGNDLEVLDVERRSVFKELEQLVEEQAQGLVAQQPRVGTRGRYRGPGDHLYYFCDSAGPSKVLARDENGKTMIETRGAGGYAVAPPSPPSCHETNRPYIHLAGPDLMNIPTISPDERDVLLNVARSLT